MNELLASLAPAISALANFFGESTEFIKANFCNYVLLYGRYCYAMNISKAIFTSFISGLVISIGLAICILDDEITFKELCEAIFKVALLVFLVCAACGVVWFITTTAIPFFMSPEIWSIEQTIKLIQN